MCKVDGCKSGNCWKDFGYADEETTSTIATTATERAKIQQSTSAAPTSSAAASAPVSTPKPSKAVISTFPASFAALALALLACLLI